jgi:hypothetical protein
MGRRVTGNREESRFREKESPLGSSEQRTKARKAKAAGLQDVEIPHETRAGLLV